VVAPDCSTARPRRLYAHSRGAGDAVQRGDIAVSSAGQGAAMPIRQFTQPGAFDPDEIAAMSEALEAACRELNSAGQPKSLSGDFRLDCRVF
jgi:hypothetical protein